MRLTSITILLFLFVFGWAESIQSQLLPFRSYSIELGLSESVAHTLVQDNRGYIWVGTGYGLNRFDGKTFKQYYENDGLANNRVHSLFQDRDGLIWVGTETGVSTLHGDSLVTPESVAELSRYAILDIFEDNSSNYWFSTDGNGLWKLQTDGQLISVDETYGLPIERVRAVRQTSDGIIWAGSREGLVKIEDDHASYFSTEHGLPELRIRDLYIDEYDRIWIGSRAGLVRYQEGDFTVYGSEHGLNDSRIQTITVEDYNRIWLGTESGVSLFDGETFQNYTRDEGVPAVIVYSSIIDHEGNIWFGTLGGGITIYVGDYFKSYNIDNGLTNNVVTGFEEDSQNNIWIATYGGGILRYDGNQLQPFTEADGLLDNKVYTLLEDSQNRLWVGTRDGISIFDGERFTTLSDDVFPFRIVRKIYEDIENNEFWIATYNDGVIQLREEGFVQHHIGNGFLHNTVMDIKEDGNGNLWFATYGGAAMFDGHQFNYFTIADGLPSNGVIQVYIDHNEDIWFSTFNGIARHDGETVEVVSETTGSETISYFTIQDRNSKYWVGTNRGLFHINPEILLHTDDRYEQLRAFRIYNQNQGLIANELNAGASMLASDGTIWLGTVEGLSRFFPERIRENNSPPGIEFEEILVSGKEVRPGRSHQFKHDQNFVQISYSGLSYEAPDQVLYEYRMKGLDEGWQTTRERTIRYPSLSPGQYQFELRAYNADGIRSAKTADFSFNIMLPFYFQWWFLMLIALLIVALVLFYMRYFRVRKQVDIERMRVQIASDLHDDVGSSLTELALQTDFLQAGDLSDEIKATLQQLGEHSRKIVSSLDDIVWSIDSRNDTAGDLTDRMQDYVNQVFANGEVEFHYNFDQLRVHEKLPVDVKENVYLIFKEAINNVVKHSNASKVDIHFSFSGKNYELVISDNGTSIQTNRKSGQGLRNIKMRAERIGSNVEINTNGGFTVKATGSIK
jgi:ligand-binding sensor domain-containing protein/two-component sensor histidine kinase